MHHTGILTDLAHLKRCISFLGLDLESVCNVMATTGAVLSGDIAADHILYMIHKSIPRSDCYSIEFVVYGGIGELQPLTAANVTDGDIIYETFKRQQLFYRNVFNAFNALAASAGYTYKYTHDDYPHTRTAIWRRNDELQTFSVTFSSMPIASRMKHTKIGLMAGYIYNDIGLSDKLMYRHYHIQDVERKRLAWVAEPDYSWEETSTMKRFAERYNIIPDAKMDYNYTVTEFMKYYDTLSETGTLILIGTRAELTTPPVQRRIRGLSSYRVKYIYTDEPPTYITPGREWGGEPDPMSSSQSTIAYESESD